MDVPGAVRAAGAAAGFSCLYFAAATHDSGTPTVVGLILASTWVVASAVGGIGLASLRYYLQPRVFQTVSCSWYGAFWSSNFAFIAVACWILPRTYWPTAFLGLGIAVNLSYASARLGCALAGCCWQSPDLPRPARWVFATMGGPLPVTEALTSNLVVVLGLAMTCVGLLCASGPALIAAHGTLSALADCCRLSCRFKDRSLRLLQISSIWTWSAFLLWLCMQGDNE